MNNRIRVAKLIFSLDAVLGILAVGGACLYAAAYNRHAGLLTCLPIFVPLAVLWSSFCYWAYKGLTSEKAVLKFVFWSYVVCNVFSFPIGTGIAGVSIWLWRDLRKQNIRPVSA
jgi:hypothetical protein